MSDNVFIDGVKVLGKGLYTIGKTARRGLRKRPKIKKEGKSN